MNALQFSNGSTKMPFLNDLSPWKNGFLSNPGLLWIQFGAMTSTRSLPRHSHRAQFPGDYVGDLGDVVAHIM